MISNKAFVRINWLAITLALANILLMDSGTQFWYDISRQHYEAYLMYTEYGLYLFFLLAFFPLWSLYRLYKLQLPTWLLVLNVVQIVPVVSALFTVFCSAVFLPAIVYIVLFICVAIVTHQRAKGWLAATEGGRAALGFWYFWQVIFAVPILFVSLLLSVGCEM